MDFSCCSRLQALGRLPSSAPDGRSDRACVVQVKAAKEAEVQAVQAKEVERARRELLALTEQKDAELAEKGVSLKQCLERMVSPRLVPCLFEALDGLLFTRRLLRSLTWMRSSALAGSRSPCSQGSVFGAMDACVITGPCSQQPSGPWLTRPVRRWVSRVPRLTLRPRQGMQRQRPCAAATCMPCRPR